MVDNWREVGGAPKFQLRQTPQIGVHHSLNTCDTHIHENQAAPVNHWRTGHSWVKPTCTERICGIEIDGKLVGNLVAQITGGFTTQFTTIKFLIIQYKNSRCR